MIFRTLFIFIKFLYFGAVGIPEIWILDIYIYSSSLIWLIQISVFCTCTGKAKSMATYQKSFYWSFRWLKKIFRENKPNLCSKMSQRDISILDHFWTFWLKKILWNFEKEKTIMAHPFSFSVGSLKFFHLTHFFKNTIFVWLFHTYFSKSKAKQFFEKSPSFRQFFEFFGSSLS